MSTPQPASSNLRNILASRYFRRPDVERLVNDAGLDLGWIAWDERMVNTWQSILEAALEHGVQEKLIELTLQERPNDDALLNASLAYLDWSKAQSESGSQENASQPEALFFVPFPRNEHFQGREQDLSVLRAKLAGNADSSPPVGLTGMGGIGKTQLAVEYVYCYRDDYPGGVFWVNAAEDWIAGPQGFAALGIRLQPTLSGRSRAEQVAALASHLRLHPDSLLVLDNVADPGELDRPLGPDFIPGRLPCRTLFTTRQRHLGRFTPVEVSVLPEEPALKLLLRHPDRQPILAPDHPEYETARRICRTLGYLPLALEIAAAHLGRFHQTPLQKYLGDLLARGALAVLDDIRGGVRETDLGTRHNAAVAATLAGQWASLTNPEARLILRVAGQLPGITQIPRARLGLLAGVDDEDNDFFGTDLDVALRELSDASLVEELQADDLRLHPLVYEFAARQTMPTEAAAFQSECALRLFEYYKDASMLERQILDRGIAEPEQDLLAALGFLRRDQIALLPDSLQVVTQGESMLRLIQRESHLLSRTSSAISIQTQINKRAVESGLTTVATSARNRLTMLGQPYLNLRWCSSRETPELERTVTGHGSGVRSVAVTPDNRRAISCSSDCTLKIWNLASGQEERTLRGHAGAVYSVAVMPDGRYAISASDDHTLKIWNLASGQEQHTLSGHTDWVLAVAVTPDGKRAVSCSADRTVRVWNLGGDLKECILSGHDLGVNAVAVTPDGKRAISASDDSTLKVWNLENGKEERTLCGHVSEVLAVAVTPDGRRAISASADTTLKVWNLENGQEERTFSGHGSGVRAVVVTPDGRRAISGMTDHTLRVWNLESGQEERSLSGHGDWVRAVAVTLDGRRAISASDDHTSKVWNLERSQEGRILNGHANKIWSLVVIPGTQQVISASEDGTLKVWNSATGDEDRTFEGHGSGVCAVAVTPDGKRAVSGSSDHTLKVWNLESGQEERTLSVQGGKVCSVGVTPDGRQATSVTNSGTLQVWNLESGQVESTSDGNSCGMLVMALTPDGKRSITVLADNRLQVWNVEHGGVECILSGHDDLVRAVAVAPEGNRLISAAEDGSLKVWDIETGRELASIYLEAKLFSVALLPEGKRIVTGDAAGNMYCLEYVEPPAA